MQKILTQQIDQQLEAAQQRLMDWLRIASVSTDPTFKPQIQEAAHWAKDHLTQSGLEASLLPTAGHPVVVAHTPMQKVANPNGPRILFYGHYDVQPPDPLEKWTTSAFEPTVRDSCDGPAIYARGACDDKGQVACFLEALRAYCESDTPFPCPITVMLEGEEECGSVNLPAFLEQQRDILQADICIICDTGTWYAQTPAITYALRGLVYFDVKLHGPSRDLHSGVYGGTLANPATQLMRVLGQLVDENQRITIPDFYDDVAPISHEEWQAWSMLDFDEDSFLGPLGVKPYGEAGYSTLERRWSRPSCDINGLYGGYMGEGAKTVIPTFAGAKVSFRIPPNMNPTKVAKQFTDWLETRNVGDCRWEVHNHGEAWPVMTPTDSKWVQATAKAVEAVCGRSPALIREGATIPVVADLKRMLDVETLLIGFGLDSDNIHSPDEHFSLARFELGIRTLAAMLGELAKADGLPAV